MISLGGLMGNSVKLGNMDVKLGQVVSNPFVKAFIKEAEGEDHEVSMGQNQLDTIIKMATELKAKMGEDEKEIPAWIQDHISKAENYISQAAGNYHEYGTNESINESFEVHYSDGIRASKKFGNERQAVQFAKDLIKSKKGLQFVDVFNTAGGFHSTADIDKIVAWWGDGSYTNNKAKKDSKLAAKKIDEARGLPKMYVKYMAVQKKVNELEAKQKEMAAKYFAEKELNKKSKMLQDLKKGTEQLASYRRNLAAIEDKYVTGLYADAEYEGE